MADFSQISQANRVPYWLKIGLIVIGFLLIMPVVSAETVKLLENTDICQYMPELDLDYCYSKYEICDLSLTDVQKSTFLFRDERSLYTNNLSSISSKNISIVDRGMCKELTISAYKSPFKTVDNVLCTAKRCYYEFVWWNASFRFKFPLNASTTSGQVTMPVLLNDSAVVINNFPQYIWCNYTVNTTRRIIGYLYFTNESFYRCVDETETFAVSMDVDEGNETDFGNPYDPDIVAVYHLGDCSGTTCPDSSINNNDVTKVGADNPAGAVGQIGRGQRFNDSADDKLNYTATVTGLTAGNHDRSMGAWMNFDTVSASYFYTLTLGETIIGKNKWALLARTDLSPKRWQVDLQGDNIFVNYPIPATTWIYVVIVYTAGDKTTTIYVDGVLIGSGSHASNSNLIADAIVIGAEDVTSTSNTMDGIIDEARVWDRALSADEILAIYNNTVGTDNFAPLGPVIELGNTSLLAINRELQDFIFSDSNFINASIINFNTSSPNTTFLVLSSMNIEKLDAGGTNVITVRIILDSDEILIEEDLRTVTGTSDIGSAGTSPVTFSVASGEHNITYQFKRSGPGNIQILNFDFNMIQFVSNLGNNVRNQLLLTDFNHTDTSFTTAFNWTMVKTINSTTFIIARNTLRKTGAGSTIATYFFENLATNDTSPFWQRFISDSSDIGSVSGIYIDPEEAGTHNHSIQSRQTDAGDVVFVNGSLVDFDLEDSDNFTIPFFQVSNESTNLTDSIILGAGIHLLAESSVLNVVGDSYFISFFTSFSSTTGIQTPRYFLDSPNLTSGQCFTEKLRTLSDNNDIGNAFAYTICEGLSANVSYTFRLWVDVGSGESLTQLDENLLGFETTNFSITEGQVAPIASAITNPINGSNVSGSDIITWLPFFESNEDLVTYNVTLLNLDGTHNATIGLTNSTSLPVNWNSFQPSIRFLQVEGCDPGDLCSETNISIRIIFEPRPDLRPSITICEDNILVTEANKRTITDGNITDEITITRVACTHGCSNWTITTLGNPGCEEGDFFLSIIFIIVLIIMILIIRGAAK